MDSKLVVLNYIGLDKENAITRKKLCEETGFNDRKVRECIEELRKDGYYILNDSDGIGYYRCVDTERLEKYYWTEWRRAISTLTRLKAIREQLKSEGVNVIPPKPKKKEEEK